jgi:hypothetical protein
LVEDEVEEVKDAIACYGLDTVAAIVAYARERGRYIPGNVIANMAREDHLIREGDRICLPEDL